MLTVQLAFSSFLSEEGSCTVRSGQKGQACLVLTDKFLLLHLPALAGSFQLPRLAPRARTGFMSQVLCSPLQKQDSLFR